MEPKPPPSSGRVVWREGLIFGVILGVVHIVLSLLNQAIAQSGLGLLVLLLNILLWLGLFFWAGARAAKQTGRVGIGSLTGLVTAVFAGFIALIALIINGLAQASLISQQLADVYARQGQAVPHNLTGIVLAGLIIGGAILWVLGIGTGAGMGALGGLLGRSQSTVVPPMGPANPAYGQPPMQPPYPPPPSYIPQYPPPYQNQPPQWPQQ